MAKGGATMTDREKQKKDQLVNRRSKKAEKQDERLENRRDK